MYLLIMPRPGRTLRGLAAAVSSPPAPPPAGSCGLREFLQVGWQSRKKIHLRRDFLAVVVPTLADNDAEQLPVRKLAELILALWEKPQGWLPNWLPLSALRSSLLFRRAGAVAAQNVAASSSAQSLLHGCAIIPHGRDPEGPTHVLSGPLQRSTPAAGGASRSTTASDGSAVSVLLRLVVCTCGRIFLTKSVSAALPSSAARRAIF